MHSSQLKFAYNITEAEEMQRNFITELLTSYGLQFLQRIHCIGKAKFFNKTVIELFHP